MYLILTGSDITMLQICIFWILNIQMHLKKLSSLSKAEEEVKRLWRFTAIYNSSLGFLIFSFLTREWELTAVH